MKKTAKIKGFTLIEILVVIGIIAVLATIVIIAINPARQFAQARNTQRQANINSILNAIGQHIADNKGIFLGGSPACPALAVSTASSSIMIEAGTPPTLPSTNINLSCLVPTYIPSFPTDPDTTFAVTGYSGYDISTDANGRVMVCASKAQEPAISGSTGICVIR
ncbi:MAG: type II secretion system protein [Minisyncoccia bacterium]